MDPSLLKTTKKVENPKVTTKAEAKATTKAKAEQATRKVTNINISDMTDEQLAENLQTISKSLKNATKQKA
jgi:chromatin segregation and condensation protein Rec8/ScpA/Scc1 (kleisin family)